MTRIGPRLGFTLAVTIAGAFAGCAGKMGAARDNPEQARLDEAAVRRTLAETEQRINKGDLEFVNVFAKDAVIVVPSAPDIAGF